jgi:hypothetical protein
MSSSLVPYRGSTTTLSLTTSPYANASALITSRLFTAQTGQAVVTELLYRLLYDLLNRLLVTLHRTLAKQLDTFSSFLERRYAERLEARSQAQTLDAVKAAREADSNGIGDGNGGLRITEEVGRVAMQRGFIGGPGGVVCPPCPSTEMGEWKGPPWVADVLEGIEQGRMVEKDFWVHPFAN